MVNANMLTNKANIKSESEDNKNHARCLATTGVILVHFQYSDWLQSPNCP